MSTKAMARNLSEINTSSANNVIFIKEEFETDDYTQNDEMYSENVIKEESTEIIERQPTEQEIISYKTAIEQTSNATGDYIDDKLTIQEAIVDIERVKEELDDRINVTDVQIEPATSNLYYYCEECGIECESFCMKCPILSHILDASLLNNNSHSAKRTIPKCILEIKEFLGYVGIFALKSVPKGVIFGPFYGLTPVQNTIKCAWKLKTGKLINAGNENYSNWMQYISTVKSTSQKNLIAFQHEGNLYYRTDREISKGEELLIHFDGGHRYNENDADMYYYPMLENDIGNIYACTLCCLGFSSEVHLAKHKTRCPYEGNGNTFEAIIQCPVCKMYLNKKEYLAFHVDYCHKDYERKWILPVADVQSYEYISANLENKLHKTHDGVKSFQCKVCNKKFLKKSNLQAHIGIHSSDKHLKCPQCEYRSNRKGSLAVHVKKVHGTTAGSSKDHKSLKRKKDIEQHIKICEDAKRFECKICGKSCTLKGNLVKHLHTHFVQKPFACHQCEYKCKQKDYLIRHIKNRHRTVPDGPKEHKCDKCDFVTNSRRTFKRHMNKHDETYKCEVCDKTFTAKSSLKRHITTHAEEKLFACDICDYKCNRQTDLKLHVVDKHNSVDGKMYKCTTCGYETNHKTRLEDHLRMHTGIKPFECDVCGRHFTLKSNMKQHNLIHTGEKRFACPHCNYGCNKKGRLQQHWEKKHAANWGIREHLTIDDYY